MTPREIAGSLYFAERRRRREAADQLVIEALGARAEPGELKRQLERLRKD